MPNYDYSLVTAFTRSPFGGNPALIVFLDPDLRDFPPEKECAEIAATFNQPIACFVITSGAVRADSDRVHAQIRFWAPGFVEPPICGHGTLASTFALFERFGLTTAANAPSMIDFETRLCGTISARRVLQSPVPDSSEMNGQEKASSLVEKPRERIEIELPLFTPERASDAETARLSAVVTRAVQRASAAKTGENESTPDHIIKVRNVVIAAEASTDAHAQLLCLIEVDEDVENLELDTGTFAESAPYYVNIVTSRVPTSGAPYDYKYRMFAPRAQVPEDHVCGSANCLLGPYWAAELGRTELKARAASRRGGEVWVSVDHVGRKLRLQGEATVVSEGKVHIP